MATSIPVIEEPTVFLSLLFFKASMQEDTLRPQAGVAYSFPLSVDGKLYG